MGKSMNWNNNHENSCGNKYMTQSLKEISQDGTICAFGSFRLTYEEFPSYQKQSTDLNHPTSSNFKYIFYRPWQDNFHFHGKSLHDSLNNPEQ